MPMSNGFSSSAVIEMRQLAVYTLYTLYPPLYLYSDKWRSSIANRPRFHIDYRSLLIDYPWRFIIFKSLYSICFSKVERIWKRDNCFTGDVVNTNGKLFIGHWDDSLKSKQKVRPEDADNFLTCGENTIHSLFIIVVLSPIVAI